MTYPAKYPSLNQTTLTPEARAILERIIRVAFPHPNFPDSAYERAAGRIISEAEESSWFRVILTQGLITLGAQSGEPFLDLPEDRALAVLRRVADLEFFGFIRRTTVLNLYDDPEVWQALGYEGESFSQGGYLHRGFNDLAWLPGPRVEEYDGDPVPDVGPLPYAVDTPGNRPSRIRANTPQREEAAGSAAAAAAGPAPESGTPAGGAAMRGGSEATAENLGSTDGGTK